MKFVFCFITFFVFGNINSQTTQKIKFQKNSTLIYFFPKSAKSDSIIEKSNDLFYLVVPDSLKKCVVIFVENGQLLRTANDSLVRLNYMQGLKYESQFVINEIPDAPGSKTLKKEFSLISLINGTSSHKKNKILIQVVNKKEDKVLMENVFYYKN